MDAKKVEYLAYRLKIQFNGLDYYVKILQERKGPEYYNKENALRLFASIEQSMTDITKF